MDAPALFSGFRDVWTAVAAASELRAERPLGVRVADTPVALFRTADGGVAGLVDRCPHRGVALSLGKVEAGCLACPFHGWRFDGDGCATHVPWNPDAKRERLRAIAVPVRERAGLLWVYTGDTPREEPWVAPQLLDPKVRVSATSVVWRAHWTRVMENMLDWPHLPFVHANTIGRGLMRDEKARMDVIWEPTSWGATSRITIDGEAQEAKLDFVWPNAMTLHIPIKRRVFLLQVACIPQGDTTRLLLSTARDFLRAPIFDFVFHWQNRKIAAEDRAVLESSQPPEVPPPRDELSVRTDALPLYFRKRYYAELRGPRRLAVVAPAAE